MNSESEARIMKTNYDYTRSGRLLYEYVLQLYHLQLANLQLDPHEEGCI